MLLTHPQAKVQILRHLCHAQHQCTSYLVLALKVLEEGLIKIGGDGVEQRPQHALCEFVVVQIFHLDTPTNKHTMTPCCQKKKQNEHLNSTKRVPIKYNTKTENGGRMTVVLTL